MTTFRQVQMSSPAAPVRLPAARAEVSILSVRRDSLPNVSERALRMGISVPPFGEWADVRLLTGVAVAAEAAGWDGLFVWDHIRWPWADEIVDVGAVLTSIALATERIRFGPMVTPLPRRRPAKVARETVTLDRLSGGRLVFGVGAGGDFTKEFADLGEATDASTRAALLDEGLAVVAGLWSGEPFSFEGEHYRVRDVLFLPRPAQSPRIPVWVAGQWPRPGPIARATRWDGYVPLKLDFSPMTPEDVAAMAVALDLPSRPGFELVVSGSDEFPPAALADAGATWWITGPALEKGSLAAMRRRVDAGPPSV
jgi:alkanesulfonate monooxygenase SsuD/methylene tetrahydromethanopterin reductase-like flavin-dependent oxidoreductase (luciferase family)